MKLRLFLLTLLPLLLIAGAWWLVQYLWTLLVKPERTWRLAVSADQLANTAFNGNEDETISSRAGRNKDEEMWACVLCWLLNHIDQNHCEKSTGV